MNDDEFAAENARLRAAAQAKLDAAVPGAIAGLRDMAKNAKSASVRAKAKRDLERRGFSLDVPEAPDGE